ncbi:MAG: hypothetical protein HY964_09970 [Ignavibacteriales bacterium]|nr:hypothetical protein [Ignavibacteriales bacterium]
MGKVALFAVFGFTMVLGIILPNSYRNANEAYDNYTAYYKLTQAHDIAVSAANLAADSIFLRYDWRTGYNNVNFAGGKFSVVALDTAPSLGETWVKLLVTGEYEDSIQRVEIILAPGNFAQYGYYSNLEGSINWITGDTVWGRMHSQSKLNIIGSPVFMKKVTTKVGTNPKKSSAKFLGGFQSGVDLPLPANLTGVTSAATTGGRVYSAGDLWITLKGDSILWKTSATGTVTRTTISAYAPNGVIAVTNGSLHVQGTFSGQATLCATGTSPKGNIYIDDDVLYQNNPETDPSTSNMLGLVAQNNVIVSDNVANGTNCRIDAALFCLNGGLTAENYSRSVGPLPVLRGTLTLYGGLTQYQRGGVGTASGGSIATGYLKNYRYDNRLATKHPPSYPLTGKYQVISWLE